MDKLRLVMACLALGGLGITGYLTYEKLLLGTIPACGLGDGCNIVLSSPYASVAGLPLAAGGMVLYAAILGWLLAPGKSSLRWWVLWGLTTVGMVFSGYLMTLLVVELKALCPYCLGSAAILTTLWLTTLITQPSSRSKKGAVLGGSVAIITLVGVVGLYNFQKNTIPPIPTNGFILNANP